MIKIRQNIGWRTNDEKPKEQRINEDRTQDGFNEEPKKQTIKSRQNLGWSPNDKKSNEQRIN